MSCDVGEVIESLENELCFPLLHLCHSSFSNPSFASPTSQNFHLHHLASRPCHGPLVDRRPQFEYHCSKVTRGLLRAVVLM